MLRKLCFGGVFHHRSRTFYGHVEPIEAFEKIVAAKGVRGERIEHSLNFAGDDVAVDEAGGVEDGSEQPHGQEVLDEHLLNGGLGEVGVDGLTAFLVEVDKCGRKLTSTSTSWGGSVRSPSSSQLFCNRIAHCGV